MPTFLLTWNPDTSGWPDSEYTAAIEATAAGRSLMDRWSVGLRKSGITVGDRAYLVRQRHERGIVASGWFTSGIFEDAHWDGSDRTTTYADVRFDTVLPTADRLDIEDLRSCLPSVAWDRLQGSGVALTAPSDQKLERLWGDRVAVASCNAGEERFLAFYDEGAVMRVLVNRYERDRAARAACIAHHGTRCLVCGFDFAERYGRLGDDFIAVHHVREISTLRPDYQIDPLVDLVACRL